MNQTLTIGGESKSITMLKSIWDEIGYTEDEKNEALRKINAEIEEVRARFIENTLKQCQKVISDTEQIRSNHISMLKAIGCTVDDIKAVNENGRKGTIKQKYDEVKSNFKEFSLIYDRRYNEFIILQKQIDNCFHSLGINDPQQKGEFAEIGDADLTTTRLREYENKISQLSKDIDSRLLKFNSLKDKILSMNSDLQEALPEEIEELLSNSVYSDEVFEQLNDFITYLTNLLNTRKQYISEMAVEINRLWDLLGVNEKARKQFLASHNTLSQNNVQDCMDEAERLTKIRNSKLPEIIEKLKLDLKGICKTLGYSKQKEEEICQKCEKEDQDLSNENSQENKNDDDVDDIQEEEEVEENAENSEMEEMEMEEASQDENASDEDEKFDNIDDDIDYSNNNNNVNSNNNADDNTNDLENDDKDDDNADNDDDNCVDPILLRIFNNYNNEILHLRKMLLFAQPIIDLINQREQIINDFEEVNNKSEKASEIIDNQNDPETAKIKRYDQLNGKGIKLKNQRIRLPDHKEKLHSEKVIRRHKFVLPRIEKKLYIMLIQFREENGEDFLWKEKPIIEELGNIQVTQDEINQNKIRFNRIKKKIVICNINAEAEGDNFRSPSKHRRSMFVSQDKIEPKKTVDDSKKNRSPRKSAVPREPKKLLNDE